jgi:hypothetical protein
MKKLLSIAALGAVSAASFAWTLNKTPDIGPWWHPLGQGGTPIYANSFIFNGSAGDSTLSQLGVYLMDMSGGAGGQDLTYYLLADSGNAPSATILSTSVGTVSTNATQLTLITANMTAVNLTPGQRYWVAARGMGNNQNTYQTGGHTQNSVQVDNGTFWYSNPDSFSNWDGQGLTPEMAIYVNTVPEPGTMIAIGVGVAGLIARRRRK